MQTFTKRFLFKKDEEIQHPTAIQYEFSTQRQIFKVYFKTECFIVLMNNNNANIIHYR